MEIEHYLMGMETGSFRSACRHDVDMFASIDEMLNNVPVNGAARCSQCEGTLHSLLTLGWTEEEMEDADANALIADIRRVNEPRSMTHLLRTDAPQGGGRR